MNLKESKIYTIIFVFIFSLIFISALAYINSITKERIHINSLLFKKKAILNSININYVSDEDANIKFDNMVKQSIYKYPVNNRDYEIITSEINNEKIIAIINTSMGLWGTITAVAAFDEKIIKLKGIDFISHSETPGLGGRIDEAWFKEQFRNELLKEKINMYLTSRTGGDKDKENSSFDSISGATRTSEAVMRVINDSKVILQSFK